MGALIGGNDSLPVVELKMSGYRNTASLNAPISSQPLQQLAEEMYMPQQQNLNSEGLRSSLPSQMYAWPFGRIYGQTQP